MSWRKAQHSVCVEDTITDVVHSQERLIDRTELSVLEASLAAVLRLEQTHSLHVLIPAELNLTQVDRGLLVHLVNLPICRVDIMEDGVVSR